MIILINRIVISDTVGGWFFLFNHVLVLSLHVVSELCETSVERKKNNRTRS